MISPPYRRVTGAVRSCSNAVTLHLFDPRNAIFVVRAGVCRKDAEINQSRRQDGSKLERPAVGRRGQAVLNGKSGVGERHLIGHDSLLPSDFSEE